MGTASLVLGIIAVCTSFIPIINNASFFLGILGVIFGLISLIKKRKIGISIAGLVLGILAIIITLSLQSSWSKTLNELSNDLDDITGDNTEEILKNNVDVVLGDFVGTVDEYGLTDTSLPVKITNKSNKKKSFSIQIEAVSADGTRIDSDTVYVNNLNPGQTQNETAFIFVTSDEFDAIKSATFKIVDVSMY